LGDGDTEQEAAGLDTGDERGSQRTGNFGELFVGSTESGGFVEQRRNVAKEDSGLWKARDGTDVCSKIDVGGHGWMLAEEKAEVK
jgi:hypothetical protein